MQDGYPESKSIHFVSLSSENIGHMSFKRGSKLANKPEAARKISHLTFYPF